MTYWKWAHFRAEPLGSYPPDYGAAFAFSSILCPLRHRPVLRRTFLRRGTHRVYRVPHRNADDLAPAYPPAAVVSVCFHKSGNNRLRTFWFKPVSIFGLS